MYLRDLSLRGIVPSVDPVSVAVNVVTALFENIMGRRKGAQMRRAACHQWRQVLTRIPEDNYIDYAGYVRSVPDLFDAWKKGSYPNATAGTLEEFGIVNVREFGVREGARLPVLPPGPRPKVGAVGGGPATTCQIPILRSLSPLSDPVPTVPGINDAAPGVGVPQAKADEASSVVNWPLLLIVGGAGLWLLRARY